SVRLVWRGERDVGQVLGLVLVERDVAAVVPRLFQQPGEDALGIPRVGDARALGSAVGAGDAVPGRGLPVDDARRFPPAPLDAGREPLDARDVALHEVVPVVEAISLPARVFEALWDQVLGARKDEDVGVVRVVVPGKALVGLACYLRDGEVEAVPEEAVAGAR